MTVKESKEKSSILHSALALFLLKQNLENQIIEIDNKFRKILSENSVELSDFNGWLICDRSANEMTALLRNQK